MEQTLGTVRPVEGGFELAFARTYRHPSTKVWRALTDPDELRRWFPAVVEFDLTPGAKLRFDPTVEQRERFALGDADGSDGEMLAADPPRLLEYTWGAERFRWELADDGSGGCLLSFTQLCAERDDAIVQGAGWHAGLERVEAMLDERELPDSWARAEELAPVYVRELS